MRTNQDIGYRLTNIDGCLFGSGECRFGVDGKENDNKVKGEGNCLDFESRIQMSLNNLLSSLYFMLSLMIIQSCSSTKYHKIEKGIIPQGATVLIIRDESHDTLYSYDRSKKIMHKLNNRYTGKYRIVTEGIHKIIFECNIEKGVFEGDCVYYYPNGNIMFQGCMKNGLKHGYFIWQNPDRTIKSFRCYCNDEKVGVWKYYIDGKLVKIKDYGLISSDCKFTNSWIFQRLP